MPRRERDPRPSIEVIGGPSTEESVQEVELGGSERGSRWWRIGLAALVGGIGLVAVLGGGSDDDGQRSAASSTTRHTARRTTTSSTTTTLPPPSGPVLPVHTGASLLITAQSGGWLLLDLDTGAFRAVELRGSEVNGGIVPVSGGIVMTVGLNATYLPILSGGEPVELGEGGVLLPSGRADRVWIGTPSAGAPPGEVRLVDLQGRTLARRPSTSWLGATAEGPIISDGGRTFVVGADGPRSIGIGQPVGWSADAVVVRECDAAGTCVPTIIDVHSGARRELQALRSSIDEPRYGTVELTPDGDVVALDYAGSGRPHLRWLDGGGDVLADGDIELDDPNGFAFGFGFGTPATFLPSRQGLVLPTGLSELAWVRPVDGRLVLERRSLPRSHRVEQVALISP